MGDRHDRGQGQQGRHRHTHGTEDRIPVNGKAPAREERQRVGGNRYPDAHAIQEMGAYHHVGQWDGICRAQDDCKKAGCPILLLSSLFFMGKGAERIHQQAGQAVYTKGGAF